MQNAFHAGEIAVQTRAGESGIAARNAAALGDRVMRGALPFLHQQSSIVLGAEAADGALWATLTFGDPGFVHSDDGTVLTVDRRRSFVPQQDPVWRALHTGSAAGLLAIELATRRRIRINGTVSSLSADAMQVRVEESFPNCPKYITQREVRLAAGGPPDEDGVLDEGTRLPQQVADRVRSADVLFLASVHCERGLDVSHRGGAPGFVQVESDRRLVMPDYPGNGMFQTLGNLELDARIGAAIPDFVARRLLHLTGTAQLRWEQPDAEDVSGGTRRFLAIDVDRWLALPIPAGLTTTFLEYSRFNPR